LKIFKEKALLDALQRDSSSNNEYLCEPENHILGMTSDGSKKLLTLVERDLKTRNIENEVKQRLDTELEEEKELKR